METPQLFLYENSLKLTKSAELYKIVAGVISSFEISPHFLTLLHDLL